MKRAFLILAGAIAAAAAAAGGAAHPASGLIVSTPAILHRPAIPTVLASADGPFVLDSGRPLTITLHALRSGPGDRPAAGKPEERRVLLLRGVTANRQPGILFQIYLGTAAVEGLTERDPRFVGTFNAFRARASAPPAGSADEIFESWDVTSVFSRVRTLALLIVPMGTPEADARVTIRRVELTAQ
jgi:hypothetical protein